MSDTSGELIGAYIEKQLDREQQRRQSLETRAAIVLSGSVAAVAVLVAILTYAQDKDQLRLTGRDTWYLYVSLISFGFSILASLLILRPRYQSVVDPKELDGYLTEELFRKPADYSARRIAEASLGELKSLILLDSTISGELLLAQLCQLLAFVMMAAAVLRLYQ